MVSFTIRLAEMHIGISAIFDAALSYCRAYLSDSTPDHIISITPADIEFERLKSAREDAFEGIAPRQFSDAYLETLAIYRKIAEIMPSYDTMLFHGSAIAVDGDAFLFTAKSGTGKSTHTRLWRERFGDRAVMVNDDKPLLRVTDSGVWVCGTPWDGKHRLSTNTVVPLRGVCILERGETNEIEQITTNEALPMLLQQSYRPAAPQQLAKTLGLVSKLTQHVNLYRLKCNMDPEAAAVAYAGMRGKDE